jgi:hypothetical protein
MELHPGGYAGIDTDGKEVARIPRVKEVFKPFREGVTALHLRGERGITYYNNKGEVLWEQAP